MCVLKKECEFQYYENYLNAAKISGKLKYLEKKKFDIDKLKGFVKNKTILKHITDLKVKVIMLKNA